MSSHHSITLFLSTGRRRFLTIIINNHPAMATSKNDNSDHNDDDNEEEILLSRLLADDTVTIDDENEENEEPNHLDGPCSRGEDDDDDVKSTLLCTDVEYRGDLDDYFSSTVQRLQNHDPTLQSLELCNQMLWDFDRWRRHPVEFEGQGSEGDGDDEEELACILDMEAWLNAIALLLRLAKNNPQIVRLEFINIPINHPIIVNAIMDVLTCDERIWLQWTIEECGGFDARFLADAMTTVSTQEPTCIRIQSIHLINTRFSSEDMSDVGRILASNNASLTELRVTEMLDASAIINLTNGLVVDENHTLTRLDFQGSCFEDDYFSSNSAVGALADALRGLRNLLTLSFAYCGLSDHHLAALLRILNDNKTLLCWLDLSRNDCGLETCQELSSLVKGEPPSDSLTKTRRLRGLTMNGCKVGDPQLAILRSALVATPHSTLQYLHLCDNLITDHGLLDFVESLPNQPCLSSLWLSGNDDFGDRGARALLKAVQRNHQLEDIVLDSYTSSEYCHQIQYFALLNKGGCKLLQSDQHNVPLGLWPLVLERAMHLQHSTTRQASAADILYHLLQGPALSK